MPTFFNRATLRLGDNLIDSNTVQGELVAALSLRKTAIPERYRPGDVVAYALTLTNSGASEAANLQIRDDLGAYSLGADVRLPLTLVDGSVRYFVNGERQADPAVEVGNGFTVRSIRVPANGDAVILYAARTNEFAPLGEGATIVNTARLDDASSAGIPANPSDGANNAANPAQPAMPRAVAMPLTSSAPALPVFATAEIAPETAARLSMRKALSPEVVAPGEELTYTLTIVNEGATELSGADGASVSDAFNPRMDIRSVRFNGEAWSAPANYSYDANSGMFATAAGQLNVPAARFVQDANTGRWQTQPGESVIEITGTLR